MHLGLPLRGLFQNFERLTEGNCAHVVRKQSGEPTISTVEAPGHPTQKRHSLTVVVSWPGLRCPVPGFSSPVRQEFKLAGTGTHD